MRKWWTTWYFVTSSCRLPQTKISVSSKSTILNIRNHQQTFAIWKQHRNSVVRTWNSRSQITILTVIGMPSGDRSTGSQLNWNKRWINKNEKYLRNKVLVLPPTVSREPSQCWWQIEKYNVYHQMPYIVQPQYRSNGESFSIFHVFWQKYLKALTNLWHWQIFIPQIHSSYLHKNDISNWNQKHWHRWAHEKPFRSSLIGIHIHKFSQFIEETFKDYHFYSVSVLHFLKA